MPANDLTPAELEAARRVIATAFAEDLAGMNDVTTDALIPPDVQGNVAIASRQAGVLAGLALVPLVLQTFQDKVALKSVGHDGMPLEPGTVVAELAGPVRTLLTAERTILNLLTLLSGVATHTRRFVELVAGTKAQILDTRKTLPGLRRLQKYAVRCGGGTNHRMGLFDGVLIKDNHLAAWVDGGGGSIADALRHVRSKVGPDTPIEVEVDTLEQLQDALAAAPDFVLLDNMDCDQMTQAVALRDEQSPETLLEASGGVNLDTVAGIAATGVDRISVGALTHSSIALDLGFDWID